MSYGEYKFGDFMKNYDVGGPSDGLVGFAEGFAAGFVPAYAASNKAAADKELALAKLDKQAEIDAAKAKAKTTSDYNEMMKKAKNIVSTLQLPTGINPNDAVMTAYTMLSGGISDNTVLTQLSKAIEDKTLVYSDESPTETAPTTTPEEAPEGAPASPLDQEMNEAFGDQSAVQPAPEAEPTVVSQDDTPAETDGEPVQEASLGSEWAQRFVDRQEARINAASETQIAALDTQTDVTNPDGLGGGDGSAADIVLADADGVATPSERTAATVRTLKINPLAKTAAAEEIEVNKIDDYEKAMAAVVALTGVAGQEDKLKRAKFLLKQFTDTPKVGDFNEQKLTAFIRQTSSVDTMPPEYKGIDPQVMAALRTQAIDFLRDAQNTALPSLSSTDPDELRGVQRDITAGRINNVSKVYKDQLAQRIDALDLKAEAERVAGLTPEQVVQEAQRAFMAGLSPDLSFEDRKAAIENWQSTEGQLLLSVMRFTDKPDKPQEISNFEEALVNEVMRTPEYENADSAGREALLVRAKGLLTSRGNDTLTSGELAQNLAQARLDLTSKDPKVVADAQLYIDAVYPTQRQALADVSSIGKTPNRDTVAILTDGRRIAVMSDGNNGYTDLQGKPVTDIQSITTEKMSDNTRAAVTAISGPLDEQAAKMAAAVNVATLGYELEKMATEYEGVLTRVGGAQAFLSSVKVEIGAALNIIGEASDDQELNQETVLQKVNDYLSNSALSEEEAAMVKEFMAASTRYIFAAGKALGQEGNGFSNQDYNNIRSALLNSNNLKSFGGNMRTFARERLTDATRTAKQLAGRTGVRQAKDYGGTIGNEIFTADQYFTMLGEGVPDAVDYMAWAYKGAPIEVNLAAGPETPAGQISENLFNQYVGLLKSDNTETLQATMLQALTGVLGSAEAAQAELDRIIAASTAESNEGGE